MKPFQESKELRGNFAEDAVKFDRLDCCALAYGFAKNPNAVKQFKKLVPENRLKSFEDVLLNTHSEIKFMPSEEMKIVYYQIAQLELKRLSKLRELDFQCHDHHSIEDHKKALEKIIKKFAASVK